MFRLDLQKGPRWVDLGFGVEVEVLPFDTEIRLGALDAVRPESEDPAEAFAAALEDAQAPEEEAPGAGENVMFSSAWRISFAKAVAHRAILGWRGVGDDAGTEIEVSEDAVSALLDVYEFYIAFERNYIMPSLMKVIEGNGSAPALNGITAGARNTAPNA